MRCVRRRGVEAKKMHGGGVKKAISRNIHKAMCRNSTEENKKRQKSMKNKANKTVSKAVWRQVTPSKPKQLSLQTHQPPRLITCASEIYCAVVAVILQQYQQHKCCVRS